MVVRAFKIIGLLLAVSVLFFGWKFYFRFLLVDPHNSIVISLPFTEEDDNLIFINPMGEIDHHEPPRGHPGLDFAWYQPAPLIAVVDGRVTKIEEDPKKEFGVAEKVYDVDLVSGAYAIRYSGIAPSPGLKVGMEVKQGDVMGRGGKYKDERGALGVHYSVHWEFDYDTPVFDRLCPLTYFDKESLLRINKIWNKVGQTYNGQSPEICSGFYKGRDSL